MKLHKWYYQKRNSIAHYRAIHEPVKLDAADWNTMIKFNFEVIDEYSCLAEPPVRSTQSQYSGAIGPL